VFRRLFKSPEEVPYKVLVDYMIVLACSGKYYRGFDDKSIDFIEKSLNLIEQRSIGTDTIIADKTQKVQLQFNDKQTDYLTKILTDSSATGDNITL